MCTGLEPAAIAAINGAGASAASSISQMRKSPDQPALPAQQQPEKPPMLDLFKRRARGGGAYGAPDSASLTSPSTGTALLGQ